MSKYYSLETLIEAKRGSFCDMYDLEDFLGEIPEEKILKITRCKDCKYYHPNYKQFESDKPYNRCEHPAQQFDVECYDMWLETNPDDFCSYAEQKEIEGE